MTVLHCSICIDREPQKVSGTTPPKFQSWVVMVDFASILEELVKDAPLSLIQVVLLNCWMKSTIISIYPSMHINASAAVRNCQYMDATALNLFIVLPWVTYFQLILNFNVSISLSVYELCNRMKLWKLYRHNKSLFLKEFAENVFLISYKRVTPGVQYDR